MAASYWDSTQRKFWTFTKQQLAHERKKMDEAERNLIAAFPLPERRLLSVYFCQQIGKMARPLIVRQQAVATAQIYVKRFYTKVEVRRTNPALVLATALYLACKMEECPQHIRMIMAETRHAWGQSQDPNFNDISKIGECEFSLISEMNSQLIIHHPYRVLSDLQTQFLLTPEEASLANTIINDHYMTDLPLLYAPHEIAVTALFLGVVLKPTGAGNGGNGQVNAQGVAGALQTLGNARGVGGAGGGASANRVQKLVDWLAESAVSVEAVVECTQELLGLYEVWDGYDERRVKDQIGKFVSQRGLDK